MKFCSATQRGLTYLALGLAMPLAAAQGGAGQEPVEMGGTTIIGDRELPIGLYISPWRSANPEDGIDSPSRYVDVGSQPIDPDVFKRQVEYLDALSAAARRK